MFFYKNNFLGVQNLVMTIAQSDEIFKDIFKNDISDKIVKNEGLKVHSKSDRKNHYLQEIGVKQRKKKKR